MHEVEKEEQNRLRHNRTATNSNEIKMYITRNSHLNKNVYNKTRCNEVVVFSQNIINQQSTYISKWWFWMDAKY